MFQFTSIPIQRCSLHVGLIPRLPLMHCLHKIRKFWHLWFTGSFQPKFPGCCLTPTHARFANVPLVSLVLMGKWRCCSFCAHLQTGLAKRPKLKTVVPRSDSSSPAQARKRLKALAGLWNQMEYSATDCSSGEQNGASLIIVKVKHWFLGASQFYQAHFIFPTFIWIIRPLLAIKKYHIPHHHK